MKPFLIYLAIFITSLTGCMTAGNSKIASETNASISEKIKIGKTTREEVRTQFGEPRSIESNSNTFETWTYVFIKAHADGKSFIPFAGVFIGGGSSETTVLVLSFKKDGIVSDYHFSENASGQYIKTGAAIDDKTTEAPTKAKAVETTNSPAKAASPNTKAIAKPLDAGPLVGKKFKDPYNELEKSYKIGKSAVSFGPMGKQILVLDATDKSGRRVLVFKELGTDNWVTTGDIAATAPAKVALVGTAEEDDTGDGPPATTCSVGGKSVQGFGFLKASKGRFDQPTGSQAWIVDAAGVPTATTKLFCKF